MTRCIYLDTAATAKKPSSVTGALDHFYREEYATVHRAIYASAARATERYNQVRAQVQHFLGANSPDEIIFTKGTTEGINLVASSFGKAFIHRGDEVIISEMEHHSNIVPWQLLCQERGAILKFIPIDANGELILDAFEQLLTDKTRIVSIAHIANSTGTINPIEKIIALSHAKGAKVLIDGAQAAAYMPVDVCALDADFYVFSGHKAYGPTGIGILYGKKALLQQMPPYQGGGDMIEEVTLTESTYQDPPLRFEAGTPPIAEVIGLGAALAFIEGIGRKEIAAHGKKLLEQATKRLSSIPGLRIIGTAKNKGPILSFTVEGAHPLDIGTLLDLRGFAVRTGHLCAQPTLRHFGVTALTRISFGVYNTPEEVDLFADALEEVLRILASK
ncbi:MAG: cysteine desulfurase [Verrucomicrobia bacterium]|nr:cysteine desulfurase [Verrucomicrobiota bacterium]